jgi:tetratricopeptide (TPR) repeat protein
MNPRSTPPTAANFDAALALARDGRFADAVASVVAPGLTRRASRSRRAPVVEALVRIGRIAESAGNPAGAVGALDAAAALAPDFADVHTARARMLLAVSRRSDARRALEAALRIHPGYVAARVELALLDAREGMLAESLAALRRLGEEKRASEAREFHDALSSLEVADWDGAEAHLKRALRLDVPGVDDAAVAARERLASGDPDGAAAIVTAALERHEAYADLHHLLGLAELEAGRVDDAFASLARALELHPEYHDARVTFARALEAMGDFVQAGEQVGLVLQHDPEHPAARELDQRWTERRGRRSSAAPVARSR